LKIEVTKKARRRDTLQNRQENPASHERRHTASRVLLLIYPTWMKKRLWLWQRMQYITQWRVGW